MAIDSSMSMSRMGGSEQQVALSVSCEELQSLSQSKLLALQAEMEQLIQMLNGDLVQELARREELDYEKEVKNRFITMLVQLQVGYWRVGVGGSIQG